MFVVSGILTFRGQNARRCVEHRNFIIELQKARQLEKEAEAEAEAARKRIQQAKDARSKKEAEEEEQRARLRARGMYMWLKSINHTAWLSFAERTNLVCVSGKN